MFVVLAPTEAYQAMAYSLAVPTGVRAGPERSDDSALSTAQHPIRRPPQATTASSASNLLPSACS
jgi:hypothetical protein